MRKNTDVIIIGGVPVPAPDEGFTIKESTYGDFGRNSKNQLIGDPIGRPLWKIEGLQWSRLTPDQWKSLKTALKGYTVPVTFTNDENERITVTMYPSDRQANPIGVNAENHYEYFKTCKFNLIDCGWDD